MSEWSGVFYGSQLKNNNGITETVSVGWKPTTGKSNIDEMVVFIFHFYFYFCGFFCFCFEVWFIYVRFFTIKLYSQSPFLSYVNLVCGTNLLAFYKSETYLAKTFSPLLIVKMSKSQTIRTRWRFIKFPENMKRLHHKKTWF